MKHSTVWIIYDRLLGFPSLTRVVFISLTGSFLITERSLKSEMLVACVQSSYYFACQHCDKE